MKNVKSLISLLFVVAFGLIGYALLGSVEGFSLAAVPIGATAIAGASTESIRSLHDFQFKPEVVQKLYSMYGQGFMLMDEIRNAAGREIVVSAEEATTQIEDFFVSTLILDGASTDGATPGATASIVLDLEFAPSGHYYAREGFSVFVGDVDTGLIECRIVSIVESNGGATVTLTIKPYDITKTIGTIASGTELMVGPSAYANETGQPRGTSSGLYEHSFEAQLFKETKAFGGAEMAQQKWVYVDGIGWYNQELARGEFLLDQQIEAAYLMGQPNTNSIVQTSLVDGKSLKVRKIKGIWPTIDELGGDITWDGTTFSLAKFSEITDYLITQGVTTDVVQLLLGLDAYRGIEEAMVDWTTTNSAGATDYTKKLADSLFGGKTERVLDYGFNMFKKDGVLFVMKDLPGYKLRGSGMIIPMGYVKDTKSGVTIPNLQARYVGLGSFSRKRVVRVLDGMSGFKNIAVNDVDANYAYWLSHLMLIFEEANKALLLRQIAD